MAASPNNDDDVELAKDMLQDPSVLLKVCDTDQLLSGEGRAEMMERLAESVKQIRLYNKDPDAPFVPPPELVVMLQQQDELATTDAPIVVPPAAAAATSKKLTKREQKLQSDAEKAYDLQCDVLQKRAFFALDQQDFELAVVLFRELAELHQQAGPAHEHRRLNARYNSAVALYAKGRPDKALRVLEEVLRDGMQKLGKRHHVVQLAMRQTGVIFYSLDNLEEAVKWFSQAYSVVVPNSREELTLLLRMHKCWRKLGRPDLIQQTMRDIVRVIGANKEAYQDYTGLLDYKKAKANDPEYQREKERKKQQAEAKRHTQRAAVLDYSHLCVQCGALANKRCANCDDVQYCSSRCQDLHFPEHRHQCVGWLSRHSSEMSKEPEQHHHHHHHHQCGTSGCVAAH